MRFFLFVFLFFVFVFGCIGSSQNSSQSQESEGIQGSEQNDGMVAPFEVPVEGVELVGPFYESFSVQRFEAAKKSGKTILLEFFANWCPVCARQKPEIEQAFMEISDKEVVGFQVNFKDNETDDAEKELARKFGVSYQHSHVIVDSQENVLLKEIATQWSASTVKEKLEFAKTKN